MKAKTYIFALAALCAASPLFATEDKTVIGGTGNYQTRVSIPSGDYNVILQSGGSNTEGDMFKGNGASITSLDASGTPGESSHADGPKWNLTGNLSIDVKSAANATAFTNGTNKLAWNIGILTISNSLATADTFTNVNLGSTFRMTVNNTATEKSAIIINTNTNLSGSTLTFASGTNGGLTVNSGKIVNSTLGNIYVSAANKITLQSDSALNLSGDSYVTLYNTAAISIAQGATLNMYGFAMNNDSSISSAGSLNLRGTNPISVRNLTLSGGTLTAQNMSSGTYARLSFLGTSVLNNATANILGGFEAKSGATVTIGSEMGDINLYDNIGSDTQTYEGRVFLNGGGTLVLNKTNAFTRVTTGGTKGTANLLIVGTGNTLEVNAANKFKLLYFSGNGSVNIKLSDNLANTLFFNNFSVYASSSGTPSYVLNFDNFQDNMIFFAMTKTNAEKLFETLTSVTATTIDGETLSGADDFMFVEGTYSDGTTGVWLNAAVVPEPAEWAAILGALALFFAAKRRR